MSARACPAFLAGPSAQIVLFLAFTIVGACGDDQTGASEGGTTSDSSDSSGASTDTGSDTADTESETETGDPATGCDACTEDELCVAEVGGDACSADSGYTLSCQASVPACDVAECDEACLDAVCGDKTQCVPSCGNVPGVDLWCGFDPFAECDPMAQDCPEGEKCVPYASTGGTWDANKCVAVTGDNGAGDPCAYSGPADSSDDCDAATFCFGVEGDPPIGTCYGFCEPGAVCPDGQGCLIANDDSITLCLDTCVPYQIGDCSEAEVCLSSNDQFLCMPGVATLDPDAPCELGEVCAPGQTCVDASELDACAAMACCTDYCDTSQPDTCTPPHTCQPAFEQGQAPAGLEDAGLCKVL